VPAHKSGEFFGFYSVFEKFSSILGPLLFSVVIATSQSSRPAILGVIAFFALGAVVLSRVNVREGRERARAAEADLVVISSASTFLSPIGSLPSDDEPPAT
jgi:UMF1 family MFS transporter